MMMVMMICGCGDDGLVVAAGAVDSGLYGNGGVVVGVGLGYVVWIMRGCGLVVVKVD